MDGKSPRLLTVAKLHWTRASGKSMAEGALGYVSITVEEGGKLLASLRRVQVSGKIWQPSRTEWKKFESHPSGHCGCDGHDPVYEAFPLLGCYVVTGVSYPSFKRKLLSAVGDLAAVERIRDTVKGFVHGRLPREVPKQEKAVLTLWDPTGMKQDRLRRQVRAEKVRLEEQRAAGKARGPGRRPRKKPPQAELDWALPPAPEDPPVPGFP